MKSQERLKLLVEIAQSFNSSLDIDEILSRVMDRVISSMGAERGFVVLPDSKSNLEYRAARGIDNQDINNPDSEISKGAIAEVLSGGKALLSTNAQEDDRLKQNLSVISLKLRSILCVPLNTPEGTIGAIYVDNRLVSGTFSLEDQQFLTAIAASATNALEQARLFHESTRNKEMERDLNVARKVQQDLIPQKLPEFQGWDIAEKWIPAKEVAGDFYDVIDLGQGKLCFLIGDVSGKGAPAAIFMTVAKNILSSHVSSGAPVSSVLMEANRELATNNLTSTFVSVFIGIVDTKNGEMFYCNGGHNPPYTVNGAGQIVSLDQYHGPVLGALQDSKYEETSIRLESGDCLVLYTDGVTEAINENDEYFGDPRFIDILRANSAKAPSLIVETLVEEVNAFRGKAEPADDVTLLLIKRL